MGSPNSSSVASLLRLVAAIASFLLIVGFIAFASDKAGESSRAQVDRLANVDPTARQEKARERKQGPVREFLDDSNEVLLKPFSGLFDFKDAWARRGVPTLLGLLLYGGLLTLLANYLPKKERGSGDWRT